MGHAEKDVDAPIGEMQGKLDEPVEELNALIQEQVKETQEPTEKRTSKKLTKRTSKNSPKRTSSKARMPHNIKTDIKKSDVDIKKRCTSYRRSVIFAIVMSWLILNCSSMEDANHNDNKKSGINHDRHRLDTQQKGITNHNRLLVRQCPSGEGICRGSAGKFACDNNNFGGGTQEQQALHASIVDTEKEKINHVSLLEMMAAPIRRRASSSLGTPTTSPSSTAPSLTASAFSSHGNRRSPSTLAPPRRSSPRSASSSPPAQPSTTSTWSSVGGRGRGSHSQARGTLSQKKCPPGRGSAHKFNFKQEQQALHASIADTEKEKIKHVPLPEMTATAATSTCSSAGGRRSQLPARGPRSQKRCPSSKVSAHKFNLKRGTQEQQALHASIADTEKEKINHCHRASPSSGTPTTSPSSTTPSPTTSAFSSHGNCRSPSTTSSPPLRLALPRRSSPGFASSSPPARPSTTSTLPSAGGRGRDRGLQLLKWGTQSQKKCPSSRGLTHKFNFGRGTQEQQALHASVADTEKEKINRVPLPEMTAALVCSRASSSSGTPTTSPSSTAPSPTASAFSSRENRRSPSTTSSPPPTLALPRQSSPPPGLLSPPTCSGRSSRSTSSSPPAQPSTTLTRSSAGGRGSQSPIWGTRSQRQCPFGEGTSRERRLPHDNINTPQGDWLPSHDIESGFARENPRVMMHTPCDIESGSPSGESTCHDAHSLDHVRNQQRFAIPHASLFELNLVAAGLLTDGLLSQVKEPVLYVLIFLFLLGFLGYLGGESIRSSKIRGTGSVATVLAFLITILLLVIQKY